MSLLANPRLSPELRQRIDRRLGSGWTRRQRDPNTKAFHRPRPTSLPRLLPFLALATVIALYTALRYYEGNALERRREALLGALSERRAELPPARDAVLARVGRWATELAAGETVGEVVSPEIGSAAGLQAELQRPALYLHGQTRDLATPAAVATATTSVKDAFLLCLYAPPPSRDTKDILAKVRGVNFGGSRLDELTPNVRRFEQAREGLAVLAPDFEQRVRQAETEAVLRTFERNLEAAPQEAARHAGAAELLLLVEDERDANTSRVALVDLGADRLLLRTRRRLDPSRWSADRRAMFGGAILGCELALDVRQLADPR